jgi:hypothetical protein
VGNSPERADVRAKIQAEIAQLLDRHGERVVGDLNISDALEEFTGGLKPGTPESLEKLEADLRDRDRMRKLYHEVVATHESLPQTYGMLLNSFGEQRLPAVLTTMRKAIKEDMQFSYLCAGHPRRLGGLYSDLLRIETISSLIASAQTMKKQFPALADVRTATQFTGKVLQIANGPGSPEQVKDACDTLITAPAPQPGAPAAAPPADPVLAEKARAAVRKFLADQVPMTLWRSIEVRRTATDYVARVTAAPAA